MVSCEMIQLSSRLYQLFRENQDGINLNNSTNFLSLTELRTALIR